MTTAHSWVSLQFMSTHPYTTKHHRQALDRRLVLFLTRHTHTYSLCRHEACCISIVFGSMNIPSQADAHAVNSDPCWPTLVSGSRSGVRQEQTTSLYYYRSILTQLGVKRRLKQVETDKSDNIKKLEDIDKKNTRR